MNYPTYIPMQQPAMQPMIQRPAMPPQPLPMRPMYDMQPTEPIWVNGRAGADAFIMGPNQTAFLFDKNAPVFYYKTTDGAGYPTTVPYQYDRLPDQGITVSYATQDDVEQLRAEISELKGALTNVKQPVRGKTKTDAEE